MYVAAWPLLKNYPGQEFQSGLFGTWMFAQYDGPKPEKTYSDIEGGLGWWRDTRFATETPKFIMGGVALNFVEWANGPGAGKGRDWKKPAGHYAIAQLSPWVLWPPDGLNLKQGTSGELFGYGYLPLPLTAPKKTTAGKDVPTGNQCWTLFLNTGNFKGPVTFFLPYFWSKPTVENPKRAGLFLDTRPSEPNRAVQMETQHIPAYIAKDAKGDTYARVAPDAVPGKAGGRAPLIHRITAYSRAALWDGVEAWFNGGPAASGRSTPRRRRSTLSRAGAGRPGRSILPTPHGTRRCPSPGTRSPPPSPSMTSPTGTSGPGSGRRRTGRSSPCRSTTAWRRTTRPGAVGGGQRSGRAGRDRLTKVEFPRRRGPDREAVRHPRRGGQLLEEAGAGGRVRSRRSWVTAAS